MKTWNFIIFVVASAIVLMISITTAASGNTIVTEEYWVLTDGYEGDFTNNGNITVSYGDFPPYITEEVFQIDYPDGGGPLQKYDSSGNLEHHGYNWTTGSGYCVVKPAVQLFPRTMETGTTYNSEWTRKEYDDNGSYLGDGSDSNAVTVTGPATVTVPAGTFTTYKLRLVDSWTNSSGGSGTSTSDYWLAKDIGWVKLTRGGVTYELLRSTPTANTLSATSVTADSATLNGAVNPRGAETTVVFEYGTTTGYGNEVTATQSPVSGTSSQTISFGLTDLSASTTYHFRVKATNSCGTSYGEDETFTTSAPVPVPTVTTGSATLVTGTSATLNSTVNPNGSSTTYCFDYGTTTSYGSTTSSASAGSGTTDVAVNASIEGLSPFTTYHFRANATNPGGTNYGDDQSFTTLPDVPEVTTGSAALLTSNFARLNGKVNPNGAQTTYYFEYGTTPSYDSTTASEDAGSGTTDVSATETVSGLVPDTTYHFRLVASNITGDTSGDDETFITTVLFVEPQGSCGGNTPCYTTVEEAVNAASSGTTINIAQGQYDEDVSFGTSDALILQGGWDSAFTNQSSRTTIRGSMVVRNGNIKMKNIELGTQ